MFHIKTVRAIETEQYCKNIIGNMNSTEIFLVLTLVLCQIKFSLSGKSDEKCNEYIQLSRHRRDSSGKSSIGKIPANLHEFPHMTSLMYGDQDEILCGGSLISDQYILTAAHCIQSDTHGPVKKVRLGAFYAKSTTVDTDVQEYKVEEEIRHPEYKTPNLYNDIGLLKLDRKVNFTKSVRPACLQVEEDFNTDKIVASGWGLLAFRGASSETLMKVELDLYTNEECSEYYQDKMASLKHGIASTMLCTGGRTESRSTCFGDAGGPIQILRGGKSDVYNLIGIISFGIGCGEINSPEVATRVSSFIPWIESIVWP